MTSPLPAGCWDLDLATGMLSLCPTSRTMFGLCPRSTHRLTEGEWASRLHPEDLASIWGALKASIEDGTPYAERFRTIHADGSTQWVLGVGRPLERGGTPGRFVGWNFDVASAGDMAADWISAHPEALGAGHPSSASPTDLQAPPGDLPPEELFERAHSILRVRRARQRLLGRSVIGEPAFDLLLCLYVRSGQKETSLSSLARPAGIPYSSAVRWIRYLADKGLVECTDSRADRRSTCVQLTPAGRAVLDELFTLR